jgi:high-affinity nickel-transport protein
VKAARLRTGIRWKNSGIPVINDNFGILGYMIVGIFVVSWLISFIVYRAKRYDEIGVSAG